MIFSSLTFSLINFFSDKENSENTSTQYHCRDHKDHENVPHSNHFTITGESSQPINIPSTTNISNHIDLDLLDEASSLQLDQENDICNCCLSHRGEIKDFTDDPHQTTDQTMNDYLNFELESNYSEGSDNESYDVVRPSSPESAFSLCSGKSHGTYKPYGCSSRDSWIIAPPPCFTGSRVGELSTIESSPLENLLIEHPSMSVYYSIPSSSLSPSHPFHSAVLTGGAGSRRGSESELSSRIPLNNLEDNEEVSTVNPVFARREIHDAQTPGELMSAEKVAVSVHTAQRCQRKRACKSLNKQKLQRQNKVSEKSWAKNCSSNNRRLRPSGCKSGRLSQRV